MVEYNEYMSLNNSDSVTSFPFKRRFLISCAIFLASDNPIVG